MAVEATPLQVKNVKYKKFIIDLSRSRAWCHSRLVRNTVHNPIRLLTYFVTIFERIPCAAEAWLKVLKIGKVIVPCRFHLIIYISILPRCRAVTIIRRLALSSLLRPLRTLLYSRRLHNCLPCRILLPRFRML